MKSVVRPEKKQLAGYGGLSVTGGVRKESPVGEDDNEEVRQRAGSALNPVFRSHKPSAKQLSASSRLNDPVSYTHLTLPTKRIV